jgi:hypothetical protein
MPGPRTVVIAIRTEPVRAWTLAAWQTVQSFSATVGTWAADTAQRFGALVSALMGPAVFSAYAFALWSLAANLGWTDSFVFPVGPLSNWLVWLGVAVLLSLAASILKRHTEPEK